jgi:hypothetical protein
MACGLKNTSKIPPATSRIPSSPLSTRPILNVLSSVGDSGRAGGLALVREVAGTAQAALDVPARPLEECLDAFWSPGLSPARLRALATARDAAAPDLLLRMFAPPPVRVRGKDLAEVLAPAYQRLAADDPEPGTAG